MSEFKELLSLVKDYIDRSSEIERKLAEIKTGQDRILDAVNLQGEEIKKMISDSEKAILAALDTQTNRLSTSLKTIVEVVSSLDKDDPEFNTQLMDQVGKISVVADALEAVGKTPPVEVPPAGV